MQTQVKILLQFVIAILFFGFTSSLYSQTVDPKEALAHEIASASKKELIDMAAAQGLSISGSESELRSRLYSHYSLQAPKSMRVELKSAQKIYSGQVSGLNQPVTRLSGGVKIQMTEDGVTHQIFAEDITIYQKAQAIYASGGVYYELQKSDEKQMFFAKNMMFNTKKWSTLLVDITGQTTVPTTDNAQVDFYLTAKKIEKTATGLVLLDKVFVTSCDEEDPHYRFRFGRLWVLNDKEAVVQNLTMYLGHVPVFYLPFYYHGQDILPMNPVIGYRTPAGIFVNTTTYLYGQKNSQDFSGGVFNVMTDEQEKSFQEGYFKMMLDYYSMLGVFGGFGGFIPGVNITFKLGVAYSRTIFDGVSIYPVYGEIKEQINTSTWFGVTLPFRYGVELEGEAANFSYKIENYSDSYFAQDFFFREENASFLGFLSGLWGDNPFEEIYQTESYLRYKNTWNINKQGLKTFAIDYLNFEFVSTVKRDTNITESASPNYYFYTPSTLNLPNIQMRLEGDWVFGKKDTEEESAVLLQEEEINPSDKVLFLQENNLSLLKVPGGEDRDFKNSFFYRWQVNERLYYQPNTSRWNTPEDVILPFDDVRSLTVTRLNFGIQTTTPDSYFLFREGFQLDFQYLSRFNESAATNPTAERKNDQSNRFFILSNVFDIGYYPLLDYENWKQTGFEYHMTARVFQNTYDQTNDQRTQKGLFQPDKHYLNGQIRYDNGLWWAHFMTKTELPPNVILKSDSQGGIGFQYWGISVEAYTYVRQNITTFNTNGYGLQAAYTPIEKVSVYQTTELDFITGLNKISVGTTIYGFKAELRWEERYLWDFNRAFYTWQTILRPDGNQDHNFVLSYLDLEYKDNITLFQFLDGRGKFSLNLDARWMLDFMRYDQSTLRFGFGFGFEIADFVQVKLSTNSINRATYLYFPFMRDKLGVTQSYDFFTDLGDSFKFWDMDARQKSNFKLENIQASVSFDLHDWVLTVIYTGGPKTGAFTITNLWENQLSFLVAWKAMPAITVQGNYDDTYGLYLGSQRSTR